MSWKKVFPINGIEKQGIEILTSDERLYNKEEIRQEGILYNDKRINPLRRYNIC